jgi:hypothetical protein
MGVDVTAYTVYGVKLDYDSELVDTIYDKDENDMIVADGMCGEYVVLGKILQSHDTCGNPEFVFTDLNKLPEYEAEYKKDFQEKFPEFFHLVDKPFRLMSFLHYS